MTAERVWVEVAGRPMHARAWGERGRPEVVLVHGLSMSSRYLVPTAEHLASRLRVYAPDLPGFGASAAPERTLGVRGLADVLVEWAEAAGVGPAVFAGNSLGCQVLLDLAVRQPGRALGLVLVGPTGEPAVSVARLMARASADVFRERPALWPIIARCYLRTGPRRTWQTLRDLVDDRPEDRAPLVGVPAAVVRGARDVIVPHWWAERLAAELPGARLYTVPGAAHAVNFGAPWAVASAVWWALGEAGAA